MGYAQQVRSPKGSYWLARYLDGTRTGEGKPRYGTVKDEATGKPLHYTGKRDAVKAADSAEAAVREGRVRQPEPEPDTLTFGDWASSWYASLQLAASTMDNYKEHLESRILIRFQDETLRPTLTILPPDVDRWEQSLRDDGLLESTIATYRGTLRTCLAYAHRAKLIPINPAATTDQGGTGRRGVARATAAGKKEKVITTILGGLVIAERMAILSGRDDEFVFTVTMHQGALRLGEAIGLESVYVTPGNLRVEWQLSEVRRNLIRAIPKDGSRGDVTVPFFVTDLISWLAGHHPPQPCRCHGLEYVFAGPGTRQQKEPGGVTVREVAAEAAVPVQAVWAALADDTRVPQSTRSRVRKAARSLGWHPGAAPLDSDWHWRHGAFERLFTVAASAYWRTDGKGTPERPALAAGEWPGEALRFKGAAGRAEWGWLPVARGATPHSVRHSMRTEMEQRGIPHVLAEAQLRHEQRGIEVYRHVTEDMRAAYRGTMQGLWDEAVARRGEMHDGSPVRIVRALLAEHSSRASETNAARNPQTRGVAVLRQRA